VVLRAPQDKRTPDRKNRPKNEFENAGRKRAFALTRLQIARCSPLGGCFQIFPFLCRRLSLRISGVFLLFENFFEKLFQTGKNLACLPATLCAEKILKKIFERARSLHLWSLTYEQKKVLRKI